MWLPIDTKLHSNFLSLWGEVGLGNYTSTVSSVSSSIVCQDIGTFLSVLSLAICWSNLLSVFYISKVTFVKRRLVSCRKVQTFEKCLKLNRINIVLTSRYIIVKNRLLLDLYVK